MLSEISIMGKTIGTYWLMFFIGVIAMIIENYYRRRLAQIGKPSAVILGLYLALCGIIGAKLLYIVENFSQTLSEGITLSGLSFFGTVYFMPIGIAIFALIIKKQWSSVLDYCVVPIITMLAIIRLGCFLNGCCNGIEADIFGMHINSLPTQLIEMVWDIAILCVILKLEKRKSVSGELYPIFMILYGIGRFAIEFIRVRDIRFYVFSNGHIFAVISVVLGIAALCIQRIKRKRD